MNKHELIRISAYDILWRARDAEFMLRESYELAKVVQELDDKIDQGNTKHLLARHHYARLSSCLWEAALVKIWTCWSQPKSQKYRTIVHGKKPALIVGDVLESDIKGIIRKLRTVRNSVAHPHVGTKRITDLAIQLTDSGEPFKRIPANFAVVHDRYAPSEEVAEALGKLILYTISEAKRLSGR